MSVEPILIALQAAFIILLYIFIWRVIRSASRDLRAAPPQESFVMAPAQAARARGEAPRPPARLVVTSSKALETGQAFEAGPVAVTIGRAGDNRISLGGDDFASGHHARVESARDGVWVIDLGSTNGTFVNGERIDGRHRLHEGDVLQIGDTELRLER
jgi:pSer/pThr/pTyr-binding forkhead associated (FHA) protein